MADGLGSTGWAYDPMGRVPKEQQTIATVTKTMGYGYDDGSLASLTYPSGRVVTYGVDSLGLRGRLWIKPATIATRRAPATRPKGRWGAC